MRQRKIERLKEKEKLRKIYERDLYKLREPYLTWLRRIYKDLKKGISHNYKCNCASCLYHFLKKRNPSSRIDKENFFLYWLSYQFIKIKNDNKLPFLIKNSDIKRNWDENYPDFIDSEILVLYCKVSDIDPDSMYDRITNKEHLRIITRYDKKYNIPRLIKARKDLIDLLPFKISPLIAEASRFLEIIKDETDQELPPAVLLFPDETLIDFYKLIYKARKVCAYIIKRKEQKIFKHREIMRNCHIQKEDLLLIIEYLKRNRIINTDDKEISKSSKWEYWSSIYLNRINLMMECLEDIKPFSVFDAKEIFNKQILSNSIAPH